MSSVVISVSVVVVSNLSDVTIVVDWENTNPFVVVVISGKATVVLLSSESLKNLQNNSFC